MRRPEHKSRVPFDAFLIDAEIDKQEHRLIQDGFKRGAWVRPRFRRDGLVSVTFVWRKNDGEWRIKHAMTVIMGLGRFKFILIAHSAGMHRGLG